MRQLLCTWERVVFWRRAGWISEGEVQGGERERRGATDTNVARTVGALKSEVLIHLSPR